MNRIRPDVCGFGFVLCGAIRHHRTTVLTSADVGPDAT